MPRLALQLARAGADRNDLEMAFVLSRHNELIGEFAFLDGNLLLLDTIDARSPIQTIRNLSRASRLSGSRIEAWRPGVVINLCPHVWTPLLTAGIRRMGVPCVTIVHDATGHPGDLGGCLAPWFRREARVADYIVTLSRFVANELARLAVAPTGRISPLFLPDLVYGSTGTTRTWAGDTPLKLLFFGRLLRYRGLALLLDALDALESEGVRVELTVAGAGAIGAAAARLSARRAKVVNRWIDETEVGPLLARHDAVVASHLECSQSGIVAAAFGTGLPVIAVPVGGLVEQVLDGRTGVLAQAAHATALARAIRRLAESASLYGSIRAHLHSTADQRSTARFLDALLACLGPTTGEPTPKAAV
jgi:glycosyltransferase involved in cell wall biosynthesis